MYHSRIHSVNREKIESNLNRRSLLALFFASFVSGSIYHKEVPRVAHIPGVFLADLRLRSNPEKHQYPETSEFGAGFYLAHANESGMDVSRAILELYGEEENEEPPSITPDLADAQIYLLLRASGDGQYLSREEREAIVVLSNWWPERFDPYYTGGPATRAELIERLRQYPSLQRAFRRNGRPTDSVLSDNSGTR